MTPLRQLVDAWSRRSLRERRLAFAVAGLFATLMIVLALKGAWQVLDGLDREIGQLSNEMLNHTRQVAVRRRVEARFAQVANQHSSAWSESEIRDRLRQEIYRLSNLVPPELDARGTPLSTDNKSGFLVKVPELGSGRLIDGGEGYRAYQIEFSIEPAPLPDLMAYLERLMQSPQSLRIDRIDLRRDPERTEFAANLVITRTVVDDPGGEAENALPELAARLDASAWTCDACEVSVDGANQEPILVLRGTGDGGKAWMDRMPPTSGVFDVSLELASTSDGTIAISAKGSPISAEGDFRIRGDGQFYRYHFQFAPPESPEGRTSVSVPVLNWSQPGAQLRIRRLDVTHVEGAAHGV
jgi:hypothetical protein